jgi:SAM-dependent methyltransferase
MTAAATMKRWELLLPLLACTACRGTLRRGTHALACDACEARFPLHHGRPVFLSGGAPPRVMPFEHISNQAPGEVHDWMTWFDGWILNIGAGGTLARLENCVEMEYSIFRHTDVVADAHQLPFADASFDAVVSFNTFEHLYDPERAAAEVLRVLKPGGRLILQTAFLQPVHEPPHHYCNVTEYGLRRWFRAFDIDGVSVSENFQPAHVIAWLASELLRAVEATQGAEAGRRLAESTLEFWRSSWEDAGRRKDSPWDIIKRLPQDDQKRTAAGFQLDARKPVAEDARGRI